MMNRGDKVVVVKPEPDAYSALMETYVGKTLTFSHYGPGPGDKVYLFCEETGEVPFHAHWLCYKQSMLMGYDYQKKRPIIWDFSENMLNRLKKTQERAKLYDDFHFNITLDDRKVNVEALPNPWKALGSMDHLVVGKLAGDDGLKPGEVHVIFRKNKLTVVPFEGKQNFKTEELKPSLKEVVQKAFGNQLATYKESSQANPDCSCSGQQLFRHGCNCGWADRNGRASRNGKP